MFKPATLVYKFLHSHSPSYFEPFLSLSSCFCSTRHSHPDPQYITVPPFHSSALSQSNILAIVLSLMLRSGMNSLMMCAVQHHWPPSGKSLKLTCLQKPIYHSLPCYPCVSLVLPGHVIGLTSVALFDVQMFLRVCH